MVPKKISIRSFSNNVKRFRDPALFPAIRMYVWFDFNRKTLVWRRCLNIFFSLNVFNCGACEACVKSVPVYRK
jgi:hypothetical protein